MGFFSFKSIKLDQFFFFFEKTTYCHSKPAEAFVVISEVYLAKFQHKLNAVIFT